MVTFEPIDEMSGIVQSRRYGDTYYVHNDSGDVARFFAVKRDGTLITPAKVNRKADAGGNPVASDYAGIKVETAANVDWEDVAYDGDRLYFCDLGNNDNSRRDLGIYAVAEPNPLFVFSTRPQAWYPVKYEDQMEFPPAKRHYDCEAVFFLRGKLWMVTKHRAADGMSPVASTNLYVMQGWRTDKPNVLKKVDSLSNTNGWVTAADISPDGKTLAVLTHLLVPGIWLFDIPSKGEKLLSGRSRFLALSGVAQDEGICWNGTDELLVTNEQRSIYRVPMSAFN